MYANSHCYTMLSLYVCMCVGVLRTTRQCIPVCITVQWYYKSLRSCCRWCSCWCTTDVFTHRRLTENVWTRPDPARRTRTNKWMLRTVKHSHIHETCIRTTTNRNRHNNTTTCIHTHTYVHTPTITTGTLAKLHTRPTFN